MNKLRKHTSGYSYKCPCGDVHNVRTEGENKWSFDGNMESPTFSPSILVQAGHFAYEDKEKAIADGCWCNFAERHPEYAEENTYRCYRCHSYIRSGVVYFEKDCSHQLAGKIIPLGDF